MCAQSCRQHNEQLKRHKIMLNPNEQVNYLGKRNYINYIIA